MHVLCTFTGGPLDGDVQEIEMKHGLPVIFMMNTDKTRSVGNKTGYYVSKPYDGVSLGWEVPWRATKVNKREGGEK